MQLEVLWQAGKLYDVNVCGSRWKLLGLSIKVTSHSLGVHVSCSKSQRLLACTVFFYFGSFCSFKHSHSLSHMPSLFFFIVSFLLLLYSEYLISSYSGTIQLPLQVGIVFFFFFFPPHIFQNDILFQQFLSMLHSWNSHWHHHFLFFLFCFSFHSIFYTVLRIEIVRCFMPKNKQLETKAFPEADRIIYCWKYVTDPLKLIEIPSVLETQISQGCERA